MFPSDTTLFLLLLWTMCCMCTLAVTVLFPSFSSCTSPLFFFPDTTLHQGISGSKCPALGLAFTKAFSFPCASTGLHTLCFFFPAQHCIGRSLDPNDHHWEMHSVRPSFHFPGLLLDCTQCKFSFFKAQHCIGRSLDPNDHMWDTHSLRIFHFRALLLDCTQSRFQRIVQK